MLINTDLIDSIAKLCIGIGHAIHGMAVKNLVKFVHFIDKRGPLIGFLPYFFIHLAT